MTFGPELDVDVVSSLPLVETARAARGADFDLKAWHAAALSLGSLGLDDLTDELVQL